VAIVLQFQIIQNHVIKEETGNRGQETGFPLPPPPP
jgi:hypothetical protein